MGRRFNRVAHKATETLNSGVEEIVNQTLAKQEIEEIVIQAVERVIFSLIKRYWLSAVIAVLMVLGMQSVFLSFTVTLLLKK